MLYNLFKVYILKLTGVPSVINRHTSILSGVQTADACK